MSPSVMTLPAMNFKFLTEGSLERTGNYRLCEKEGVAVSGAVALRDDKTVKATSTLCLRCQKQVGGRLPFRYASIRFGWTSVIAMSFIARQNSLRGTRKDKDALGCFLPEGLQNSAPTYTLL
jgi:hypothetical protein